MPDRSSPLDPAAVIRSQVVVEEHDVSADGSFAIVVRRAVSGNAYTSHLWHVPLGSQAVTRPRRLTSGRVRDSRPRIAPDGRSVAFRRRSIGGHGETGRLHVLELRNGRERPLTARALEVSEFEWSPDGARLAFTAEAGPPRFIVGREPAGEAEPLARVIRRIDWRYDESGFLDRWDQLFVIDATRGSRPRQVTAGDAAVADICWHPDGRTVAFASDGKPDADLRPGTSIWTVDVDAAESESESESEVEARTIPRCVLELRGWAARPAYSPDGRWLAAVGVDDPESADDTSPTVFVAPGDGGAPPRSLAPDVDRPVGQWTDTDLSGWMASYRAGPAWLDSTTVVAIVSDRGRAVPWRFPLKNGEPEAIVRADASCFSLAAGGRMATVLGTLGTRAPELMTLERGEFRTRTRMGSGWQRRFPWPEMRHVVAPGDGGGIETWVASPAGAGDATLPTIVDVHGGPLGAWGPAPSVEVMLLAARGYRVVLPNIRGSATFGRAWITPQLGDWGGVDAADVHAVLDHVVELGLADPRRLGVLGLSYGGFMVHWLIGTCDRFRAAVSENGVANQVSAWANSDSGVEYDRAARLGDVLTSEGVEKLWRQSPLRHVANVRTPLLILQGGADLRCPPADNEQYFTALRVLGREVEYVLYPDESHLLQATARPDRRIDRMTRMLDWFERHLAVEGDRPRAAESPNPIAVSRD
ncbi:MAG: S9 family peptidase [Chloroflexota bacterium]